MTRLYIINSGERVRHTEKRRVQRLINLFIFSQIAQINGVHRTHRNLKVIDDTEP